MERDKLIEPSVIGVLLQGGRAFVEHARTTADLQITDFEDPQLRMAYEWILRAYDQGLEPTPKILHTISGKKLPLEWLEGLVRVEDFVLDDELIADCRVIVRAAEVRETMKMLVGGLQAVQAVQEAKSEQGIQDVKGDLINRLTRTRSLAMLDSSMSAIYERHLINRGRTHQTPTNIEWLDTWLKGGLMSKRLVVIGAKQGGRKSSWARSIILGVTHDEHRRVREDVSVAWMAFENDQQITFYDFVVMCGMQWLRENNHYDKKDASGTLIRSFLDAENMSIAIDKDLFKYWPALARQAAEVGIERASALPIRIYDSSDETGALTNRTALWRCLAAHQWAYAQDKHLIVVVDYAQLVREGKADLYEDMEALARDCLRQANRLNCTLLVLTQYNEQFNKDAPKGQEIRNFQGIKGGGDLKAASHNLMAVEYDAQAPTKMNIHSGKARRGKGNSGVNFTIEPMTGLIIDKGTPSE